jgi:hypothetical protein
MLYLNSLELFNYTSCVSYTMSTRYKTARKGEATIASEEITALAKDILTKKEFDRAIELSFLIASSKAQKQKAIRELKELVAPPPKRPIYYAQYELGFLPRWTRDSIRYLGDYVDDLIKHLAFLLTKNTRVCGHPLGANIIAIEPAKYGIDPKLIDWLKRYNSFLYRPGKHDFSTPPGRSHRFTSMEVVLTAFVTMRLAEVLRKLTACDPHLDCHCRPPLIRFE